MQITAAMKAIAAAIIVAVIAALCGMLAIEKANLKAEISKREKTELELSDMTVKRDSLLELKKKQDDQIKSFNEIGARHTEELTAAQEEIARLGDSLHTANSRLRVKAVYPAAMPDQSGAGSVGDATAARLTEAAQQDYLRLRQMMAENLQQTKYLQDYIKTQCLQEHQ